MILDGGNRYQACIDLGIRPILEEFVGDGIGAYVLTSNLHRRHLSPVQQAAIIACVQDWSKAQVVGKPNCANLHNITSADRAAQSGASLRTQQTADKLAKAAPELAAAVGRGEISLNKANKQAFPMPPEEPHEFEDSGPSDEEIEASIKADNEQINYIKNLLTKNDPLAQALADVKQYKEAARIAKERMDGMMNEKNELIRMVKSLQAKLKKAGIK